MSDIISIIIPAFNEEESIGKVIQELKKTGYNLHIIVCNNNSTDNTVVVAQQYGAFVIDEPRRGYGSACLKGMSVIPEKSQIVVFIDADYSDYPEELPKLLLPILEDKADITIGSRNYDQLSRKAVPTQARWGNALATYLIYLFWGKKYLDLGPFRVIKKDKLFALNMRDTSMGWTVEMQIKAILNQLRIVEVPVRYRSRIGISKISGTIKGTIKAGISILRIIFMYKILNYL